MSKVLVLPDIHGRTFWKKACSDIGKYDKVVFLGDYLDPYGFEGISVDDAVENFREIIDFMKRNAGKVVMLLGNHDCPYMFEQYYRLSAWHCRHSFSRHKEISMLFKECARMLRIAYAYDGILFTHAGVESRWLDAKVHCKREDLTGICDALNSLTRTDEGIESLFCISESRGGRSSYASCVWSDVSDMKWDSDTHGDGENIPAIHSIRQVFGHSLQAYYDDDGKVAYGDAVEFGNCKMLDTACAYELDTEKFTIIKV